MNTIESVSDALPSSVPPLQRGVALAMSLIFLLILTLFAVVSMNTGIMQEKMSGNMRDTDVAFQSTDTAVRYASEVMWTTLNGTPDPQCINAVNNVWCANNVDWRNSTWWDANGVNYRGDGTKQIAEAYEDPKMALEKLWFVKDDVNPANPKGNQYYRLNARGRGVTGISEAVIHGHIMNRPR